MKKLIGSAFLFLAVSVLYSETVVRITANRVSILDSPSYQGQVIGQARQGETYTFQGSQGEWYKILLPGRGTGWILKATGEIETSPIQPSPAPLPHPQKTYTSPPSSTPIQQEKSEYAKRLEYLNNKLSVEIEGHWISSYSEASSYYNYNLGEALEAIIGGKKGAEIGSYFKPYNIGTGEKSGSTRLSYIKEWTPYHGGVLVSEPEFYRIAGLHKQAKLCAQYYNSYYNNARALRNKGYTVMLNGLLMGALGTPAFIWGFKNQNTDKDSEADILMAIGIIDWCIGGLDVIIGTGMVWVGAARLQAKLPKWGTASFALDVAITYNNHLKKKLGLSE